MVIWLPRDVHSFEFDGVGLGDERCLMVRIIPFGTSRLHEPMETIAGSVNFPHIGYFHSSSQMLDVLRIARGGADLPLDVSRLFFRKDQTPSNPFDLRLWSEPGPALAHLRECFGSATGVVMEISSPKSFQFRGFHVQGNPNADRSVPYSEVWRDGYYKDYAPDLDVRVFDDTDGMERNLRSVCDVLGDEGKRLVLVGHLVDPDNPHPVRQAGNLELRSVVERLRADHDVTYYDSSHLVARLGFRRLPDGSTDIHHLPDEGLPIVAAELMEHFQ